MTRLLKKGGIESVRSNFIPYLPRLELSKAANQALAGATVLAWQTVINDTEKVYDGANPSKLICAIPGRYRFVGSVQCDTAPSAGTSWSTWRKNGSIIGPYVMPGATSYEWQTTLVLDLVKGDYVELVVQNSNGGNAMASPGFPRGCSVSMELVGPPLQGVRDKPVVSYVTPAQFAALTPQDGDEVYLIVDAANGVTWHMRYNAGSSSAYKWEYLGGPPLIGEVFTSESVSGGGPVDAATLGPQVTLPRGGDYMFDMGFRQVSSAVEATLNDGSNPATYVEPNSVTCYAGGIYVSVSRRGRRNGLAAGLIVRMRYGVNGGGTGSLDDRRLLAWPVRIS